MAGQAHAGAAVAAAAAAADSVYLVVFSKTCKRSSITAHELIKLAIIKGVVFCGWRLHRCWSRSWLLQCVTPIKKGDSARTQYSTPSAHVPDAKCVQCRCVIQN